MAQRAAEDGEEVVERFYVGSLSYSSTLHSFARVPTATGLVYLVSVGAFLTFALTVIVPVSLSQEIFGYKNRVAIGATFLIAVVPALWITKLCFRAVSGWAMRAQKAGDCEKLGPERPSERYVGIAYTEGIWSYRDDTMWDRGYLDLSDGEIRFRGHASEFGLALSQIESVRLIRGQRLFWPSQPLVYVCWRDENGIDNYFSLEIRDEKTTKQTFDATVDLRNAIRDAVQADEGLSQAKFYEMPFKSSSLEFSGQRILRTDVNVALGWALLFFAGLLVAGEIATRTWKTDFPWPVIAGMVSTHVFSGIVYHRVARRGRKATS